MSEKPTSSASPVAPVTPHSSAFGRDNSVADYTQGASIGSPQNKRHAYHQLCRSMFIIAKRTYPKIEVQSQKDSLFHVLVDNVIIYQYRENIGAPFAAIWAIMSLKQQTQGQFRTDIAEGIAIFEESIRSIIANFTQKYFGGQTIIPSEIFEYLSEIRMRTMGIITEIVQSLAIYEYLLTTLSLQYFARYLTNGKGNDCRVLVFYIAENTAKPSMTRVIVYPLSKSTSVATIAAQMPGVNLGAFNAQIDKYVDDESIKYVDFDGHHLISCVPYPWKIFKSWPIDHVFDYISSDLSGKDVDPHAFAQEVIFKVQTQYHIPFDRDTGNQALWIGYSYIHPATKYLARQIFFGILRVSPVHLGDIRGDANAIIAAIEFMCQKMLYSKNPDVYAFLSSYVRFYSELELYITQVTYIERILKILLEGFHRPTVRRICDNTNTSHPTYRLDILYHVSEFKVQSIDLKFDIFELPNICNLIIFLAKQSGITLNFPAIYQKVVQDLNTYVLSQTRIPVNFAESQTSTEPQKPIIYTPRTPFVPLLVPFLPSVPPTS